jgi:hypothetical protein
VVATQRAQWLAKLSEALDEAQGLIWHLREPGIGGAEILDLSARIEAVRAELCSFRLGRIRELTEVGPEWINWSPWELPDQL